MKKRVFIQLMVATLCVSWAVGARAASFDRDGYVQSIITVLRIHADSIQNLTTHEMKYSDNVVRHALAIQRTFGLLGPMDWHAAESVKLLKKKEFKQEMDHDQFEKLAKTSRKAMQGLVRASHDNLEEHDREGLIQALDSMKDSCNSCHAYLPGSVAPDVWGTLKRK